MINIKEYYAPTGTGKTTSVLPHLMYISATIQHSRKFYYVGLGCQQIKSNYQNHVKNMQGLSHLFSPIKKIEIDTYDLNDIAHEHDNVSYLDKLKDFISNLENDDCLIIDELDIVVRAWPEVLDFIKQYSRGVQFIISGQINHTTRKEILTQQN